MVKLTVTSPTEIQSIKRAIDMPASFSPIAGLAEAAGNAIQAEQEGEFIARRRNANRASKLADKSSALANRSALDYALGPGEINSESEMLNYELDPNDFRRLRAGEAAVRQGVRSSTWLNAERSRVVDTLRAKGATDEDIIKAFKGIPGIDKSFFRDMGLEGALVEQEQKNIVAAADDTKQIELAKSYGLTGSDVYLAAEGRRISAAEQAQKQAVAAAELAAKNAAVTKDEMAFVTGQAKDATVASIRARVGGSVNSILGAVAGAWTGGANKAEFETRMQRELIPNLKANLPALESQIRDELMLIPGISADEVKSNVDLLVGPLRKTVESLEQNSARYVSIAQNLKARHNVEFAETLPVIAFLENAFGKQISETFYQLNEPQIKALIAEQKMTDWSNPNAPSALMLKAGSILRGEMSMMGQPTEVIDAALSATRDLAQQATKDINTLDSASVSSIVNGIGQLGLAANQLSVGEGEQAHFKLAKELGRSSTWTALEAMLSKPEYAQRAEATIQVVRSGATTGLRSLEALAKTKMPLDTKLRFNKKTGRYEVTSPSSTGTFPSRRWLGNFGITPNEAANPAQPWADAANRYLSLLVATEKHGLEPIKGTALQIREFHALGTVPEGAQKTKSARKSADELFEENINRLNETIQRLPESLATSQQMQAALPVNLDDKPFAPLIKDTAQRYNVPMNVITALLSVENAGLDPNAKGPEMKTGSHKGDRAVGLFQIMDKTAKGLGIDRNTIEGNIEGGIKLLAENFARTGNWRDAISMYHSGVPFDEAKNRTDGGMKTVDYVARILQRAGLSG